MTKKFEDVYVVAKDDCTLYNDCIYDFKTAESVCAIAKDSGYFRAEVITLRYSIENGYLF